MQAEIDEALDLFGLGKDASQVEIDRAKEEMRAFFASQESDPPGLQELSKKLSDKVSHYYEKLPKDALQHATVSGGSESTASKQPSEIKASSANGKGGLLWFLGIVCVLGIVFLSVPKKHTDNSDDPTPRPQQEQAEPSTPAGPPDYAQPYIHSGIGEEVSSWQSGTKSVDNVNRTAVQGRNNKGELVNELIFYSDNGNLRLMRQYIVRRHPSGLIISVQRFVPGGGGAAEFKNGSNVAPQGDVHQQTTFYKYDTYGRLLRVQVDTPFIENKDGLTFDRSAGGLYITRDKSPGQLNLDANRSWLTNLYDLWEVFGQRD